MGRIFFPIIILSLLASSIRPAMAVTPPTFPDCTSPQGDLKVYYESGDHGIPGDTNIYQGSDSVYRLDDITLIQCFCAVDGNGIQTNWWKLSSLSQEEIDILKRQGWVYIPSGSLWGLDDAPYLTISENYLCKGGVGRGQILGLATTGNLSSIYGLMSFSLTALIAGLLIKRKKAVQ